MRLHGQKTDSGGWKGYRRPSKRDRGSRPLHRGLSGSGRRQSRTIPSEAPPRRRSGRRGRSAAGGGGSRQLEAGRLPRAGRLSQAGIARQLVVNRTALSQWAQRLRKQPPRIRNVEAPPQTGTPPSVDAPAMAGSPRHPSTGGDAVRFPDRELDPVEGSCRNGAPLRSDLPCEFLLGPTEAVGLDGTGVPAVRARERDEELIRA